MVQKMFGGKNLDTRRVVLKIAKFFQDLDMSSRSMATSSTIKTDLAMTTFLNILLFIKCYK
jgi:hypothetical protein